MQQLCELYRQFTGTDAVAEALPSSGSHRRYFRLIGPAGGMIGVVGTSTEENKAFIALDRHFASKGLRVPKVLAVSEDCSRYLQEDLGARSLFDALSGGRAAGGRYSEEERECALRGQ